MNEEKYTNGSDLYEYEIQDYTDKTLNKIKNIRQLKLLLKKEKVWASNKAISDAMWYLKHKRKYMRKH